MTDLSKLLEGTDGPLRVVPKQTRRQRIRFFFAPRLVYSHDTGDCRSMSCWEWWRRRFTILWRRITNG